MKIYELSQIGEFHINHNEDAKTIILNDQHKHTKLIQWHNAIELFDYNIAIDWAMGLIQQGIETENLLIVASFSKPVNRYEITPYVSAALRDLNIEERYGESWAIVYAYHFLSLILENESPQSNLREIKKIYNNSSRNFDLSPFHSLYWAWIDLEEQNFQYYYEGAVSLDNIGEIIQKEAKKWVSNYIVETE